MNERRKKQKKLINRLQRHYRLVVMNDDNFEIKTSIKLNPLNVLFVVSILFVIYAFIIIGLLKYTPVNAFFFGRDQGPELRREALALHQTIDSLAYINQQRNQYMQDLYALLTGEIDTTRPHMEGSTVHYDSLNLNTISKEDSLLRAAFERKQEVGILANNEGLMLNEIEEKYFQPPVEGIVTRNFAATGEHFGIDIVAAESSPVRATLAGKVIFTGWTSDYGHTMAIQHEDNLVSIYKHNAVLLKKVGNFVQAGEVVALLGNTGALTEGPHLHFELWHEMVPLNPLQYIVFN